MTVVVIHAPDVADGEPVVGARHDSHGITGADVALFDDAEVRAGPGGPGEAPLERPVIHAQPELPARDARLAHLEDGGSDGPTLPDHRIDQVETLHGEVLPKPPGPMPRPSSASHQRVSSIVYA